MQGYQKRLTNKLREKVGIEANVEAITDAWVEKCKTDANFAKIVLERTEGAVAQKIEIESADVFGSFARAIAAEGIGKETAARILMRVKAEIDPGTQDADAE